MLVLEQSPGPPQLQEGRLGEQRTTATPQAEARRLRGRSASRSRRASRVTVRNAQVQFIAAPGCA